LSFGVVKGYEESGQAVPAFTTFGGLYARAAEMKNQPPFDLPTLWVKRQSRLDQKTPFNFVSTCDIIGGNSGSPVVNRAGEFVGIIFDGNLQSLSWDYAFSDNLRRFRRHSGGAEGGIWGQRAGEGTPGRAVNFAVRSDAAQKDCCIGVGKAVKERAIRGRTDGRIGKAELPAVWDVCE
jgi:hypothetical protein